MSDFGSYGGSDEEYAAVRKHNALVVRLLTGCERCDMGHFDG